MFEYHGWVVLSETTSDVDAGALTVIAEDLSRRLARSSTGNPHAALTCVNGSYQLVVTGNSNRRDSRFDDVLAIYGYIGRAAPGSYGLLYLRDDEDVEGHANAFSVWVLARGNLSAREDTLLSPCVPQIEDE